MGILTEYFKSLNKAIVYTDSSNYLNQIISQLSLVSKGGHCLVLGAGNLSDIPIDYLKANYKSVTLSDIDKSAILKQKVDGVEVKECEYTGLEAAGFFNGLLNLLNTTKDYKELNDFITSLTEKDYNQQIINHFDNNYDLIIVSPIYTQLIYKQALMVIDKAREVGYEEEILKYVESLILEKMILIINRFNNLIKSLLNDDGYCFCLSDIFEGSINDDFFKEIIKWQDNQQKLSEIYDEYYEKFGFGLGDYGQYSLSQILTEESQKYLVWPLSKEKHYLVSLMILSKKKIGGEV